ncbi:MAG TPA: hypothetical protein VHK63_06525 [Candidatus Limnocylindria bacterium]|nr:hypothetical protein [Candidatus Limnocylindria bacterium]
MRRLLRLVAPVLLASLFLAGATSAPASAENGAPPVQSFLDCLEPEIPPRCVSVGDDARHHVYFDPAVPSWLRHSVRRAMREAYGPTALRMIEDRRLTGRTDVIVRAGDYGANGAAGWVVCPADAPQGVNAQGHRWCRGQELFFNLNARYGAYFADDDSRTHLACHELGHTVGLRHWGNPPVTDPPTAATCMTANTPDGTPLLHRWDRANINAYYRPMRPEPTPQRERSPTRPRITPLCHSEF